MDASLSQFNREYICRFAYIREIEAPRDSKVMLFSAA